MIKLTFLIVFTCSILFSACTRTETPLTPISRTALPTILSTSTQTLTLPPRSPHTKTVRPTETLKLLIKQTNTATIPPVISPTPTLIPFTVLPKSEAEILVHQLMTDNGGCSFPCWWGITPGETSWSEAKQFLLTLDEDLLSSPNGEQYFFYEFEQGPSGHGVNSRFFVEDGEITWIEVFRTATHRKYPLFQFLSQFGKPEQVFLQVYTTMFDEPPPFWIILYYPNKHILAAYEYTTEQEGQYLQAVITPTGPDLCLWNANRIFKEPVACVNWAINADAGESKVISLEEATNMSIDSFYETYVEPTGEKKIETLATLWEQ